MNILEDITLTDNLTENLDFGQITLPAQGRKSIDYSWTNGTGADQVDLHWEKSGTTAVTLAAAGSVTYTLSALADALGRAVALARVKKLLIRITAKTSGDVLAVGNAAANPWSAPFGGATETVKVSGLLLIVAPDATGLAVAASSSDQLKIANPGANPITFEIAIAGCSA